MATTKGKTIEWSPDWEQEMERTVRVMGENKEGREAEIRDSENNILAKIGDVLLMDPSQRQVVLTKEKFPITISTPTAIAPPIETHAVGTVVAPAVTAVVPRNMADLDSATLDLHSVGGVHHGPVGYQHGVHSVPYVPPSPWCAPAAVVHKKGPTPPIPQARQAHFHRGEAAQVQGEKRQRGHSDSRRGRLSATQKGFQQGDMVYYAGPDMEFETGHRLEHGAQGRVTQLFEADDGMDNLRASVWFPKNPGPISCLACSLSRTWPPFFYEDASDNHFQAVAKAAAAAYADGDEEAAQHERYQGEALAFLQDDQAVLVEKRLHPSHGILADLDSATLDLHVEDSIFPGADVYVPLSALQWKQKLAKWVFIAGLDIADLLSDANLCYDLLTKPKYAEVPMTFTIIYTTLTVASFASEVTLAWWETRTHERDRLGRLLELHGRSMLLRYLAVPDVISSPSNYFMPQTHGGKNFSPNYLIPVCGLGAKQSLEYLERAPLITKLPKTVLEDFVLLCMNLVLVFVILKKFTFGIFLAASFSVAGLALGAWNVMKYIAAVRAHRGSLSQAIKYHRMNSAPSGQLEIQLADLDANPLNAAVTYWASSSSSGSSSGEDSH